MEKCCVCERMIWFWQKIGFNLFWHKRCSEIWEKGYNTAFEFCMNENKCHDLPTPDQLYKQRWIDKAAEALELSKNLF